MAGQDMLESREDDECDGRDVYEACALATLVAVTECICLDKAAKALGFPPFFDCLFDSF